MEYLLRRLKKRPRRYDAIVASFASAFGQEPEKAELFLRRLIDVGFICFRMPIAGTDPDWLKKMIAFLRALPSGPEHDAILLLLEHLAEQHFRLSDATDFMQKKQVYVETAKIFREDFTRILDVADPAREKL